MSLFRKILFIAVLQLISIAAVSGFSNGQAQLTATQFVTDTQGMKIVFNLSDSVTKGVFFLNNPERLVIDLKNTHLAKALTQPPASHPFFAGIRSGQRNNGADLRIVVDLKKPFPPENLKIVTDKISGQVIVGLSGYSAPVASTDKASPKITRRHLSPVKQEEQTAAAVAESKPAFLKDKDIVIAIDAGHGGIDAGARGTNGTLEKKVVFAIAQKLADKINAQSGMRAVMVRKGDYYIPLRKRMKIAREAKADLFVSIHADAYNDTTVRGASVYTLSNDGASSEAARWLADSENAADLIGGVSLDDKDDVLASVLLDLSRSATKEASRNVAKKILGYFNEIGKLHKNEVQKAGFMVLKSPDIPSILIETAFISNPSEETELRNSTHQDKVATAVFKGIDSYFKEYSPITPRVASSK